MHGHSLASSPSRAPRYKTYNYLLQEHPDIIGRSRITETGGNQLPTAQSDQQTQYQLIVQFQLRRQKQKTFILEQRLRNKQSFIRQMKEFQDQLAVAYEKCQQQLQLYKDQCLNYQSKFNSFATFNNDTANLSENQHQPQHQQQLAREYLEQIAELKHLVIRLQQQINVHQKKQRMNNIIYYSPSAKKQPSTGKQGDFKGKQSNIVHEQTPQRNNQKFIKKPTSKRRSKTLANEFVDEKRDQNFTFLAKIQQCIHQQKQKISSFINHFLTMCQFFDESLQKQSSIKQKLKKAWKWIKNTLVEWNYLKKQKVQKVKQYKIGGIVARILPLSNLSMSQIQILLEKMLGSQTTQTRFC